MNDSRNSTGWGRPERRSEEEPHDETPKIKKEDDIVMPETDDVIETTPVRTVADDDDDDSLPPREVPDEEEDEDKLPSFQEGTVDLVGPDIDVLANLLKQIATYEGEEEFNIQVNTVGSYENSLFRSMISGNYEALRIQEALGKLSPDELKSLATKLLDPETGKTRLGYAPRVWRKGDTSIRQVNGENAVGEMETLERGGLWCLPFYNSGFTLDILRPTPSEVKTLITNLQVRDRELGRSLGAHYFAYADKVYKDLFVKFISPLIVGSSYIDWNKKGRIWSLFKMPDWDALVLYIAASMYPNGFEGFVDKCTRPVDEAHKTPCGYSEVLTIDIYSMIVTRFSVMSDRCVKHMMAARAGATHTAKQILEYQKNLGLEGDEIVIDDTTYTMKIPTVETHLQAGAAFLADICNDVSADNMDGRYEQIGFRYIRTFAPWISRCVRRMPSGAGVDTSNLAAITRRLDNQDDDEGKLAEALRTYVDKVQLTYVGYHNTRCPKCGYLPDTPSGMRTIDPASSFFTIAVQFITPKSPETPKA